MNLEKQCIELALKFVDEAMDLERQQVESSYERGRVDAMIVENGLESKFQSGTDYYQSKYTKT